jgi:nitrite reductase/ring-hydroxylating ferredoxin subunit
MNQEKIVSQVEHFVSVDPANLEKEILKMHPGMTLTRGHHESLVNGFINDLDWNAFDYWHRIYVHNTYHDALQVFSGKHFSVNVTRWGKLPIFIQVANAWIKAGLYIQSMTILGIIYCHQVVKLTQKGEQVLLQVNWYTASHWLFRWLHGPFNRRLLKLQKVQDIEDRPIRDRRYQLRKLGFHFITDVPDFLNSNALTDHVIVPKFPSPVRVSLAQLEEGKIERVEAGILAFLVKKQGAAIAVWPALCPHEGAPLEKQHICNDTLQCPWHGRRFRPVVLEQGKRTRWQFLNTTVELDGANNLAVSHIEPLTEHHQELSRAPQVV